MSPGALRRFAVVTPRLTVNALLCFSLVFCVWGAFDFSIGRILFFF